MQVDFVLISKFAGLSIPDTSSVKANSRRCIGTFFSPLDSAKKRWLDFLTRPNQEAPPPCPSQGTEFPFPGRGKDSHSLVEDLTDLDSRDPGGNRQCFDSVDTAEVNSGENMLISGRQRPSLNSVIPGVAFLGYIVSVIR